MSKIKNSKLISKLEQHIETALARISLDFITEITQGYVTDLSGNIIGLSLNNLDIFDISILTQFNNLIHLSLDNNIITDISCLEKMKRLRYLYLKQNHISDISVISKLPNLVYADLRNNRISMLSPEIVEMDVGIKWEWDSSQQGIIFAGNNFVNPPIEIVSKGKAAIKAYFESFRVEKKALNEAKLILVGDGGAGKTSLVKRILGLGFAKDEPQTHGIDIKRYSVKSDSNKISINIWDFGGQEIMHATHQFFFSRRCLYVLVLDGRKDEKAEYWLKLIKSFGGKSRVLVVINKIDQNPSADVNRKFLLEKYNNICGFFRVSCLSKYGISELTKFLVNQLSLVELIHSWWGLNWFNVKGQLEIMDRNYISHSQYNRICEREGVLDAASQEILLEYLHDLGVVLHFSEFVLHDISVLNPKWVTNAVYKIINSPELANGKGVLKLAALEHILNPKDEDNSPYPRTMYTYLIHLMEKFELCYKIGKDTVLVPDLLQIQEPDFPFDYKGALKFQIEYDFFPKSIIPRFIVKMNDDIKMRLRWRTGVVLENDEFSATAVVKSDERDKKLFIYVTGSQKRDYFAALLLVIRKINHSFEEMEYVEKVPMPDNPKITVSYQHLLWLEETASYPYAPDGAKKKYDVRELLGTIQAKTYTNLLANLRKDFFELKTSKPQKRGFELERFLVRLFQVCELLPLQSFKTNKEQIDGSFQIGNDIFLMEAKWHTKKIGHSDLMVFQGKVSSKAKWSRGLFISISGFSDNSIDVLSRGKSLSIVGMDENDLIKILDNEITFSDAIALKLRYAAETNYFFAPLTDLLKRYKKNLS